jgi:hypothetical protein
MTKFIRKGNLKKDFIPNPGEIKILSQFQRIIRQDYKLIRCTKNMISKSTIDASGQLRELFKKTGIINFEEVKQGRENIIRKNVGVIITKDGCIETNVSFYRPNSKEGDPRFWPYGARNLLQEGVLLMITASNEKLIFIPIIDTFDILDQVRKHFTSNNSYNIEYFRSLYAPNKGKWIQSCSPYARNPKDVGETLESLLGMKPNSSKKADLNGIIEIKSKRTGSGTNDSLFSKTPNWKLSQIKSSAEMIIQYGYDSQKHPDYKNLYVTVNSEPNNQGLFLENDLKNDILAQNHNIDGSTCVWEHSILKKRLWEKHPNTVWVKAQEKRIDGKIYFQYDDNMEFTSRPIFSQFLILIDTSLIVFDWRGRVLPNRKRYRDHGHGFRIAARNRRLLFSDLINFIA